MKQKSEPASEEEPADDFLANIDAAKKMEGSATEFTYEEKDIMLYNLGLGAKKTDLALVLYGFLPSYSHPIPLPQL